MRLSQRSTDLFQKGALIAVVTVSYYVGLAYCSCVQTWDIQVCGNSCFWPCAFCVTSRQLAFGVASSVLMLSALNLATAGPLGTAQEEELFGSHHKSEFQ